MKLLRNPRGSFCEVFYMNKKTIMAMPVKCFWAVVIACAAGIVLGSFFDFNINVALANKTSIGAFFATYGSYFSY